MKTTVQNTALFVLLLLVVTSVIGCGSNVTLRGKVTYSDDNSPLEVGTVCFESANHVARGPLKSDGTYTVGSTSAKDGLPPGEYKVYITGADRYEKSGPKIAPVSVPISLIDSKFTSPSRSDLTVKVDRSTKKFDFSVDRSAASPKKKITVDRSGGHVVPAAIAEQIRRQSYSNREDEYLNENEYDTFDFHRFCRLCFVLFH